MTSLLRNQSIFTPFSAHTTEDSYPHTITSRPEKKQKMGLTQTYRLAHRARGKLSFEASRGDHDLRLLVGHANLLDTLMLELQAAEREQEAWFTKSIAATPAPAVEQKQRVQFVEEHRLDVADSSDEEEDSDAEESEEEEEEELVVAPCRQRARSPPAMRYTPQEDEEEDEDEAMESDEEHDNTDLALVRTRSRGQEQEVPELVYSSDESDDESSPSSPDAMDIDLAQHKVTVKDFAAIAAQQQRINKEAAEAMEEDGFYLPPQTQHAPMVAAY